MPFGKRLQGPVLMLLTSVAFCGFADPNSSAPPEADDQEQQMPAGEADVLRRVPKTFATLVRVEPDERRITLRTEGKAGSQTWPVDEGAAVRIDAWWGRLQQFKPGDRVWVWFAVDRQERPRSVLLLADEISSQEMHGVPYQLRGADPQRRTITVTRTFDGEDQKEGASQNGAEKRSLSLPGHLRVSQEGDGFRFRSDAEEATGGDASLVLEPGAEVFIQTAASKNAQGEQLRKLIPAAQLPRLRERQQQRMHAFWSKRGLPGTVTFLHPLAGEMELTLDHAAMRWGRALQAGDEVTLAVEQPIKATVKQLEPWRERTRLRLVTASGLDQVDLSLGQRLRLRVPLPPAELRDSNRPTGLDRDRSKGQRIEWLLCSIYCTCRVGGERCTGMVYTLAACDANACPMVAAQRKRIVGWIEEGLTDRQILEKLRDSHGPELFQPHLLK